MEWFAGVVCVGAVIFLPIWVYRALRNPDSNQGALASGIIGGAMACLLISVLFFCGFLPSPFWEPNVELLILIIIVGAAAGTLGGALWGRAKNRKPVVSALFGFVGGILAASIMVLATFATTGFLLGLAVEDLLK